MAKICTGRSICTQPSTLGPTMTPAMISITTDGTRHRGPRPSSRGTAHRDQENDEQVVEGYFWHDLPLP